MNHRTLIYTVYKDLFMISFEFPIMEPTTRIKIFVIRDFQVFWSLQIYVSPIFYTLFQKSIFYLFIRAYHNVGSGCGCAAELQCTDSCCCGGAGRPNSWSLTTPPNTRPPPHVTTVMSPQHRGHSLFPHDSCITLNFLMPQYFVIFSRYRLEMQTDILNHFSAFNYRICI